MPDPQVPAEDRADAVRLVTSAAAAGTLDPLVVDVVAAAITATKTSSKFRRGQPRIAPEDAFAAIIRSLADLEALA